MVARAFRDSRGITVVYYAKEAVATTVQVDQAALGFPQKANVDVPVSLKKGEAGYKILLA